MHVNCVQAVPVINHYIIAHGGFIGGCNYHAVRSSKNRRPTRCCHIQSAVENRSPINRVHAIAELRRDVRIRRSRPHKSASAVFSLAGKCLLVRRNCCLQRSNCRCLLIQLRLIFLDGRSRLRNLRFCARNLIPFLRNQSRHIGLFRLHCLLLVIQSLLLFLQSLLGRSNKLCLLPVTLQKILIIIGKLLDVISLIQKITEIRGLQKDLQHIRVPLLIDELAALFHILILRLLRILRLLELRLRSRNVRFLVLNLLLQAVDIPLNFRQLRIQLCHIGIQICLLVLQIRLHGLQITDAALNLLAFLLCSLNLIFFFLNGFFGDLIRQYGKSKRLRHHHKAKKQCAESCAPPEVFS